MTFESIYNAIFDTSEWFINEFIVPLINFINNTPLLVAAILISFGVPALIYVLYVYSDISSSAGDMTFSEGDKSIMRVKKHERRMIKTIHKQRNTAINAQRAARSSSYSNNKYVEAYMRSLKDTENTKYKPPSVKS